MAKFYKAVTYVQGEIANVTMINKKFMTKKQIKDKLLQDINFEASWAGLEVVDNGDEIKTIEANGDVYATVVISG